MVLETLLTLLGLFLYLIFWPFSALFGRHSEEKTGKQRHRKRGGACGKGPRVGYGPVALSRMAVMWSPAQHTELNLHPDFGLY